MHPPESEAPTGQNQSHHDPSGSPAEQNARDFQALRESGEQPGASRSIGSAVAAARDTVAGQLVRLGATPNRITLAGFLLTCGGAYCLARGASQQVPYLAVGGEAAGWWPVLASGFLLLAGACDMLDGAVARLGKLGSRTGAVLDSSVDRFSDMAVYLGCFLHFALLRPPNLTYQILAIAALCNGVLISYVKARAENLIPDCSVGYWLRGERWAAMLIGCATGHVPAVLWLMAVGCLLTVRRRISYACRMVRALDAGRPFPPRGPDPGWPGRFQLWRHPRGSIGYDLVTGVNVAYIIFAPLVWPALRAGGPHPDPLGTWLAG